MKLTNALRDAYIRAVMNDVPDEVDDLQDQAGELLDKDVIDQLPAPVRAVWDDKRYQHFIVAEHRCYYHKGLSTAHLALGEARLEPRAAAREAADKLLDQAVAKHAAREELQSKLRGVVYACTTRKALAEALPEFAKYLPAEEQKPSRMVPVVIGVVQEFTKAGWPKGAQA